MPLGHIGEWRYSSTTRNFGIDEGDWSPIRPGRFALQERAPGTHCTGGWVGLRASPDAVE
jgi:hypothetical protein